MSEQKQSPRVIVWKRYSVKFCKFTGKYLRRKSRITINKHSNYCRWQRETFSWSYKQDQLFWTFLADIRYFYCKKGQLKCRFWRGNIVLYQIILFCENCDFCLGELNQSPTKWHLRRDKRCDYQYTFYYFNEYTSESWVNWLGDFNLSTTNRKQYSQQELTKEKLLIANNCFRDLYL